MSAPDLFDAFIERAWARALLWSLGELELGEAIDVLVHDAERNGLMMALGRAQVEHIVGQIFEQYRELVE